jgi:hypothetical protein
MVVGSWLIWAGLSALGAVASVWHYRRRETAGRGRMLLAGLRAAAFAVLLLLLFNPELPARAGTASAGTQVLLDGSLSMSMTAADGRTAWDAGVAVARSRTGGRPVLVFGEAARPVAAGALPDSAPGDARSRLLPALQAAAEAGVRRVVVVTDGRIEDADAVARWAPRLGLDIVPELVGGDDVANRALAEVSAPAWVEARQQVRVDFAVLSPGPDSQTVVARVGDRVVGRTVIGGAEAGRLATGSLEVRVEPPPGGGWVGLEVGLERADAVPDDDVRMVYVNVADEPPGIALISLRPDWEPRFLAPVLEQALGLPLRAWLRGAAGQYIRLAGGLDAGGVGTEADVRRSLARAEIVVLHGIGPDAPDWALDALGSARRVLIFPAGRTELLPLPAPTGAELPGDYYVAQIPPSPLAPLLAGQEVAGATPLAALRPIEPPPGAWAPLLVTRGRGGTPMPALLGGEAGGRRWVIAPGTGYWQWSFRGGEERQLYTRLWGAVAGWLARDPQFAGPDAVRPARLATPRGLPIPWLTPGLAPDSLGVRLTAADGTTALDTIITPTAGDTAFTAAPPPGDYRYEARVYGADAVVEAAGPLTVERYSPEFSRPVADLRALRDAPTTVREGEARRGGTPLHATAFPYVILVLLLATEWILRRRWGLR